MSGHSNGVSLADRRSPTFRGSKTQETSHTREPRGHNFPSRWSQGCLVALWAIHRVNIASHKACRLLSHLHTYFRQYEVTGRYSQVGHVFWRSSVSRTFHFLQMYETTLFNLQHPDFSNAILPQQCIYIQVVKSICFLEYYSPFTFNGEAHGVCAPLLFKNNAFISPNPRKKNSSILESICLCSPNPFDDFSSLKIWANSP